MKKLIGLSLIAFGFCFVGCELPIVGVIMMISGLLITWKAEKRN